MPSFMDFYYEDINTVLMDTEERATEMEINGNVITVFKDDYRLAELKNQSQYADAIYNAEMLLHIRADDLGYIPAQESDMFVNGKLYQVLEVSGDYLLQVILGAVE